ncbi:MAG: 4Fe-4S dicluster domain-containing protein [Ruminococcaceae bacterium]|nr:4Fe-4S dicluster domain-containing protein [Oscillospiraceae bacterium]
MAKYQHSVSLNPDKCLGCTHCLRHCPTEAIRIKDKRAVINSDRCIDCGECIRVCPHQAKKSVCDKLADIPQNKWKIALPAPTLFGQFDNLDDIDYVLHGLLEYGFDEVYEVARAAELVSDYTRRYIKTAEKPVISSACPVIGRLLSLRYPLLADRLLKILPPIEIAAKNAREEALKNHPELTDNDICTVFISPCPAKVSYVKNREGGERSYVDYVVSMSDMYFELLNVMTKNTTEVPVSRTGLIGLGWASTGGEATAIFNDKYLAADGIENVMHVLEEIDNGSFPDLEFVELNACPGGCVGGVLNVTNPYIAKARLRSLQRYLPVSENHAAPGETVPEDLIDNSGFEYTPVTLGESVSDAMNIMIEAEKLKKELPGMDCGSCGAPTCAAFAQDVVRGTFSLSDCVAFMRRELEKLQKSDSGDKQ